MPLTRSTLEAGEVLQFATAFEVNFRHKKMPRCEKNKKIVEKCYISATSPKRRSVTLTQEATQQRRQVRSVPTAKLLPSPLILI